MTELNVLSGRATQVQEELKTLRNSLVSKGLRMGRLLREVNDNKYYQEYGYSTFVDWVHRGSSLDISPRTAYNMIQLVEGVAANGVSDAQIEAAGISKSVEVMSLSGTVEPEEIHRRLKEAETMTVACVKDNVAKVRGRDDVTMVFKVSREVRDLLIVPVLNKIRLQYGTTQQGEISDSRALELWAAETLAGPAIVPQIEDSVEVQFI